MSRSETHLYEFGEFRLDTGERLLLRGGHPVSLPPKVFDTLVVLVQHNGHLLDKEQLMKKLWPDTFVEEVNLSVNISALRKALGEGNNGECFIETVPKRGYRFIAAVNELETTSGDLIVHDRIRARIVTQEEKTDAASLFVELEQAAQSNALKSGLRDKSEAAQTMPEVPIASYFAQSGNPRRRVLLICGMLLILIAAAAWGWFRWRERTGLQPAEIHSIAVLPFKNLSAEPGSEYFVDGLTGELIRNLSLIEGLEVRSQTSSFTFKDQPRNLSEVGKQLHANLVLEGSVLRSADKLRINAQLVRVADDVPLWSGRFDRELKDIIAIQDEIARGIVNHLRLKLGQGRRRYETSVEAYDLYLHARSGPFQQGTPGFDQKIEYFEKATAKDPSFAPAYAGLASAYAIRSIQFPVDHPADELVKMREAAEKALELDPLLAEAHEALALAYARDGQWEEAGKSFRRAIELDANRSSTYDYYAWRLLLVLGRNEEALKQLRIEEKIDPLSLEVRASLGMVLISAGRYDEAAEKCQKSAGPLKSQCLARAMLGQGRFDDAIQFLANDPLKNPQTRGFLGYIYARSGRRAEAEKMAAASDKANEQALIFAGLGDKDRTFEALDRMAALGAQRIGVYLNFPELALLRGDPRLSALRKKVGLPQ